MKLEFKNLLHHSVFGKALGLGADALSKYFHFEIEYPERVPQDGPFIAVSNHSGFSGADAIVLSHWIHQHTGSSPKMMAHPFYFETFRWLKALSEGFGLCQSSVHSGMEVLKEGGVLVMFPEGEDGNFKPSSQRYHLQHFHTGFVRLALQAQVPVIPGVLVGCEESHLNLGTIDLSQFFPRLKLPVPAHPIPLPAHWKFHWLNPIDYRGTDPELVNDQRFVKKEVSRIRANLQAALKRDLEKNPPKKPRLLRS